MLFPAWIRLAGSGSTDGKLAYLSATRTDVDCAIGYYAEADNFFLPQFARQFTTCDMYFPSILGPTFPNRIFQLCGQTDRLDDSAAINA